MQRYFSDFATVNDGELAADAAELREPLPTVKGGIGLPFGQLGDRRFQALALRMKRATLPPTATVVLVQATWDKGRDVIVYVDGNVREIIQCKNQHAKVNLTEAMHELVKLSMYAMLEPDILGCGDVVYELWSPSDFSQEAADLFDTWPRNWTETDVRRAFEALRKTQASLKKASWPKGRDFILNDFPRRVAATRKTGLDIADDLRNVPAVFNRFFYGPADALRQEMRALTESWVTDLLPHILCQLNREMFHLKADGQLLTWAKDYPSIANLDYLMTSPTHGRAIWQFLRDRPALSRRFLEHDQWIALVHRNVEKLFDGLMTSPKFIRAVVDAERRLCEQGEKWVPLDFGGKDGLVVVMIGEYVVRQFLGIPGISWAPLWLENREAFLTIPDQPATKQLADELKASKCAALACSRSLISELTSERERLANEYHIPL